MYSTSTSLVESISDGISFSYALKLRFFQGNGCCSSNSSAAKKIPLPICQSLKVPPSPGIPSIIYGSTAGLEKTTRS
ncbi:hypothetical protein PGT21_022622 [Puccinia graminis f. sp. tritici]|uniref:Uncharacterized protein n=1 Tax=Puccinia graminis f. sp. tritici TaxID=56615 RepID=A0A5B0SHJ7_PUCGR|nr:hypothetical protein PGT21_022622 [Puccinia graminis f. sp. tritici]KAA1137317.1 hypothetical protein PGTUg99_005035 [Puccinia graminis f. sp. tritici]